MVDVERVRGLLAAKRHAGVCGAMAAAGIVDTVGGSAWQAEDAACLAFQPFTAMPCDSILGGLSQLCRSRILTTTCTAQAFADLAMAGHRAVLPLDEALDVVDTVGRALSRELRCASGRGLRDA